MNVLSGHRAVDVVMPVFCCVAAPTELFDARCICDSFSAHSFDGRARPLEAANSSHALFAAEKANHVLEAAHLMEMSAHCQNSHQLHCDTNWASNTINDDRSRCCCK